MRKYIYGEKSAVKERSELEKLIRHLRKRDVLVVWKLDRLGYSLKHLIDLVDLFKNKDVKFFKVLTLQLFKGV